MRPLIINEGVRAQIRQVIEFAEHHPLNLHDMMRVLSHPEQAPGTFPERVVVVPIGYRCVFTIEQQALPLGMCRHLSVHVIGGESRVAPNEHAVQVLMNEFGITGGLRDDDKIIDLEQFGSGPHLPEGYSNKVSINVIQKLTAGSSK